MREYTNAREDILDGAEQLVAREGVKNLTIERVAKEAGKSRGGVLYHFASKQALIEAMVARIVAGFQQALDRQMAHDSDPHGRLTRAYASLLLQGDDATGAVVSSLLAGLAYYPTLLEPLHAQLKQWQQQSEAELDPTTAAIVRLTTHALWTNDVLLPNSFTSAERRTIVERLIAMTRA